MTVISGAVPCQEAMRITDRYLHDPSLVHTGNSWSAEFEGWMCSTPTSAAAQEYGYLSSCRDERGSEIRVTPERPAGAEPLAVDCDEADIAADMGQQLNVQRCYGNWAYVDSGELGDAQSLIRLVNGAWERYTGFPSSICTAQATADGVPVPELRSFMC
ncbi:hypothetical protein [Mycobacterium sp. SMC-4]|uniref:hypothetical protein n=1 Tax=Mycobacterium sp. SMC-4 TaxID=2857059 RepID=UPI003CFED657